MMHGSSVAATMILMLVAVVTAPTSAMSQTIDSELTAKAKIALFADEQVRGRLITVETVKGVVILRGKIDSSESRARASSLVEALAGVKRVRNDLQVASLGDRPPIVAADADITPPGSGSSLAGGPAQPGRCAHGWRNGGPHRGRGDDRRQCRALPSSPVVCPAFAPSRTS